MTALFVSNADRHAASLLIAVCILALVVGTVVAGWGRR